MATRAAIGSKYNPIIIDVTNEGYSGWKFSGYDTLNPIVELKLNQSYKFRFTNTELDTHPFKIYDGDTVLHTPNNNFEIIFSPTSIGRQYSYKCGFHPNMQGQFNVT